MKDARIISGAVADCLLSLYPRRWRERYEEEFREVLDECPLSFATVTDVCAGAWDAHLHYGEAVHRQKAIQRTRSRRAAVVATLVLWGASVAIVSSKTASYRPLRYLLG